MAGDRGKGIGSASESDHPEDARQAGLAPIQMQALISHFERMLDRKLEGIHDRLDRVEGQAASRTTPTHGRHTQATRTYPRAQIEDLESRDEEEELEEFEPRRRPRNRPRGGMRNGEEDLGGIQIKIPSFQGRSDPEAYLEWEMRVEQIFGCHNYSEGKKVKLAALEFTDYALVWWDQMQKDRIRHGERPITTWEEMKAVMRRRFIPSYFHRELHNKLQRLTQGSKSVDEYHKEMEIAMIRANVEEEREATMARFLHGLNRDIADVVEMHHYVELQDMVHQAIKVEQQLRRRNHLRRNDKAAPIVPGRAIQNVIFHLFQEPRRPT